MSQSSRIVLELKRALKNHGLAYDDVARHLGISTSSIKRLFSKGGFSLDRIERIAALAGLDLVELARRGEEGRQRTTQLSLEQESELVSNPRLVLVAICALNRWRMQDILDAYQFTEPELVSLLIKLDRLNLIELLPGNRIRLRIARGFTWRPAGPIHQFFVTQLQNQFLVGQFSASNDVYQFRWGMMTPESAAQLREEITSLLERFNLMSNADEVRPRGDALGMCLLAAFKEWEPAEFQAMRHLN